MKGVYQKFKYITMFIGDIIILYLSLFLMLLIRYSNAELAERWQQHFLPFSIIFILWIIIFYIFGVYSLQIAKNNLNFYSTLLKAFAWCTCIAVTIFYLIKPGIAPKTNLFLELILLFILLIIWRQIFNSLAKNKNWINHALIIGLDETTLNLAEEINTRPQLGFKVSAIICDDYEEKTKYKDAQVEIITPPKSLLGLIKIKKVHTVIMNTQDKKDDKIISELYKCIASKIAFFDLSSFVEKFTGKIPVNSIGQIWFLKNLQESSKTIYEFGKRIFDILMAIILLIISIPFLPILYLLVKTNSRGSFFFMQQRTGRHSKKFMAVKIRTMYVNSEENGPQWAQKNDPRVTKVGKFFRKTRIDEIPQLINILRGEMSFIGPRPERPEFIEKLEKKIPFYNERLLVKPGLTGWAQINFPYGASEEDALEKLQYDLYYIKNRSFILDLSILLKTIKIVLSGGGQ